MLLQLAPQLNVAPAHDMPSMQASQVSAAPFTPGSFSARERQLSRQAPTL
jgi:hypothetical protein